MPGLLSKCLGLAALTLVVLAPAPSQAGHRSDFSFGPEIFKPRPHYQTHRSKPYRVCKTYHTRKWSERRGRFIYVPHRSCHWVRRGY